MKRLYLFFSRQFISIKNGGIKALVIKIYTLISFVFGPMLLLFVVILKPFYLIRLGNINTSRIGHLSANLEIYYSEKDLGINVPSVRHFDILFAGMPSICNKYLIKMWSRNKLILPYFIGIHCFRAKKIILSMKGFFPFLKDHLIENLKRDVDINNAINRTDIHINFTKSEISYACSKLDEENIDRSKVVLLCVRDSAYLSSIDGEIDWSYHNFRDSEIKKFLTVSEYLAEKGFFVFRMGVVAKNRLQTQHPRIIDYAFSDLRSDFMDIYLSYICNFVISTGTGIDALSWACFRKPITLVNCAPFGFIAPIYSKIVLLSKTHVSSKNGKKLSIFDIYSSNLGFCTHSDCYDGYKLLHCKDIDIKDAVIEMLELIDCNWSLSNRDNSFQNLFKDVYIEELQKHHKNITIKKSDVKFRYSTSFLDSNHSWFLT